MEDICDPFELSYRLIGYGYILYIASGLISDGSELLLLVPSVAGIVGSVVLPFLGAVPDGMMVLFSGMGPQAQDQVSVGVGALAGSTVMLLTLPWFIAVTAGRVPMKEGPSGKLVANFSVKEGKGLTLTESGITFGTDIYNNVYAMLLTSALYLVIQLPASVCEYLNFSDKVSQANTERIPALVGMVLCMVAFFGYLFLCTQKHSTEYKELDACIRLMRKKQMRVEAVVYHQALRANSADGNQPLLPEARARITTIFKPFFKKYDVNKDGSLQFPEVQSMLTEMGSAEPAARARQAFNDMGVGHEEGMRIDVFVDFIVHYVRDLADHDTKVICKTLEKIAPSNGEEEDEEEEEEVPEDLVNADPSVQMRNVIIRSCWMMSLGTLLVLIFSDPMCDVLGGVGYVLDIGPFYISFLLAPLASNASELLSAYNYAKKKTQVSITNSLSTLVGAACMNNTFCLGIFYTLIVVKKLYWAFTAETIAIITIQWVIGQIALRGTTQTWLIGWGILACYPGCLVIVYVLENFCGLD